MARAPDFSQPKTRQAGESKHCARRQHSGLPWEPINHNPLREERSPNPKLLGEPKPRHCSVFPPAWTPCATPAESPFHLALTVISPFAFPTLQQTSTCTALRKLPLLPSLFEPLPIQNKTTNFPQPLFRSLCQRIAVVVICITKNTHSPPPISVSQLRYVQVRRHLALHPLSSSPPQGIPPSNPNNLPHHDLLLVELHPQIPP